jgi:inorganic pyrophosphatase
VLNLELVDTSGEVTDQREAHERRLATVRDILATELAAREVYTVIDPAQIQAEIDIKRIQHFFEHYKDLEPEKWTRVGNWRDVDVAHRLILEAIERARSDG